MSDEAATLWLKTGIQVAQNDREANAHHGKQVLCRFEPSSPSYGRFSVQKWAFLGCFRDDRPENSQQSFVCPVGDTPWLKTVIQVAQNNRGAKAHDGKQDKPVNPYVPLLPCMTLWAVSRHSNHFSTF